MRYISRFDYKRTSLGWWVRFTNKNVIIKHKFFNDSKYKGKDKSLLAAQKWRDKQEPHLIKTGKIPKIYNSKLDAVQNRRRVDNKSGNIGVFRIEGVILKKGVSFYRIDWFATWVEYFKINGVFVRKCKTKSWAIRKWTEDGAYKNAVDYRELKSIYLKGSEHMKLRHKYLAQESDKKISKGRV